MYLLVMLFGSWAELLRRLATPLGWLELLAAQERRSFNQLPYYHRDGQLRILVPPGEPGVLRQRFRLGRVGGCPVLLREQTALKEAVTLYRAPRRSRRGLYRLGYRDCCLPKSSSSYRCLQPVGATPDAH